MGLLVLTCLLAWPGSAEREEAVERLRADPGYQKTLPSTVSPPDRTASDAGPTQRPRAESREEHLPTSGPVALLMWGVIALAGVGLVVVLVREIATRPPTARVEASAETLTAVRLEASILDDAEVLAARAAFADAIHVLLLRTFTAIERQAALPAALTSREVLARVRMEAEAHQALGQLVQAVEVSFFGHAEPGAEDYARCRASYQRVLAARGVTVA